MPAAMDDEAGWRNRAMGGGGGGGGGWRGGNDIDLVVVISQITHVSLVSKILEVNRTIKKFDKPRTLVSNQTSVRLAFI